MDESQALGALEEVLTQLQENPLDVVLHAKHIRLSQSLPGMEGYLSALELMPQFLAAGEEVWLPLIEAKEKSVDQDTADSVNEVLELFSTAEADYLSIPLLQKHLKYIIDRHAQYHEGTQKPAELGHLFSTAWTRKVMDEIVRKGIGHLSQSHYLWDAQRDWEMEMLEAVPQSENRNLVQRIRDLHLTRLNRPHSNSDDTLASYSTFTTKYQPPQEYESLLVDASKTRSQGVKAYERRERNEIALVQTSNSLSTYAQFINAERRAKSPDGFVLLSLYERAIAEAAKRRFSGEYGAEEALRMFWAGYCDSSRILSVGKNKELAIYKRALRSVPSSGEIWARYLRFLEKHADNDTDEEDEEETLSTVSDAYVRALGTKLLQLDVEQLVPVVLARAGCERRRMETGIETDLALAELIGVLESGIALVAQAAKTGDPKLRLEKYLAQLYDDCQLTDAAIGIWASSSKRFKSNYLVWICYTETLIKYKKYEAAREVFSEIHAKQVDWPEAIWEAWMNFELLHGCISNIEQCGDKIDKARLQVEARRAKEAEKAGYDAMQYTAANQVIQAPANASTSILAESTVVPAVEPTAMDVNQRAERGTKRAADEEPHQDAYKKARTEEKPLQLKRDRENCTVFIADLDEKVTDDELSKLFKDCGHVREVKITQLPGAIVATVEFHERDSVPAALTKDKKLLYGKEIAVHLAWKSTLYVTNFPESTDDHAMRKLFGQYGTVFDVRWPSKKFKNTRRFCYVQFTSPIAAQNALDLHGQELAANLRLNVYISNPERKKERTDQDANEREVYVAGISRYTTKADLRKVFEIYGNVKDIRMAEQGGQSKGYAFIEYGDAKEARAALAGNNYELKKRRIAVTMADSRVRSSHPDGSKVEIRNRSVRVKGLPASTQEGLLHQALGKITRVKRVEVYVNRQEAMMELENAAEVGRLLLRVEPVVFEGCELQFSVDSQDRVGAATAPKAGSMLVPRRAAVSRPRAGLGRLRTAGSSSKAEAGTLTSEANKGQDDFRKMINKGL